MTIRTVAAFLVATFLLVAPAGAAPPAPGQVPANICAGLAPCVPVAVVEGGIMPPSDLQVKLFLTQAQRDGAKAVVIVFNSPGGSYITSKGIYNAIAEAARSMPVLCVVDEIAASGAFLALQACTERVVTPGSLLGTHHPFLTFPPRTRGTKRMLQQALAAVNEMALEMETVLAARMGMSLKRLQERLDQGDWVMSAAEALEYGAADAEFVSVKAYIEAVRSLYSKKVAKKPFHPRKGR